MLPVCWLQLIACSGLGLCKVLLTGCLWLTQVHAQEQRTAADAAAQQAASQQVIPGDVSSLATLQLPESELPPGVATLNLTKLAPLLPLLAGLNATVLASWLPVIERTPPESLALAIPALNALNASTLEGLLAALPLLNWETVIVVLPLVNALPASTLTAYLNLLQDVSQECVSSPRSQSVPRTTHTLAQ